jgi:hypothetical protein
MGETYGVVQATVPERQIVVRVEGRVFLRTVLSRVAGGNLTLRLRRFKGTKETVMARVKLIDSERPKDAPRGPLVLRHVTSPNNPRGTFQLKTVGDSKRLYRLG